MGETKGMVWSSAGIEQQRERVLRDGTLTEDERRRRGRFLARLAEIAREYETPLREQELVKSRIRWEDWARLRELTVDYAESLIWGRRWRGQQGGVLPEASSAEDVADYAIREMLEARCGLEIGFTRERVEAELKRLVKQRVGRLHKRRETRVTRSEWELVPRESEGAEEPVSVIEELPDPAVEMSIQEAEAREERAALKKKILDWLKSEPRVKEVFECVWAGVIKPAEIASRLEVPESEVVRMRKRLDRRLRRFAKGLQEAVQRQL